MNFFLEGIFITEIMFQAKLAKHGSELLTTAKESFDDIGIWSAIQTILSSAGNISKTLWPIKDYKERGEQLRKLLNVEDDNILRSRKFRNQLEHFDELIHKIFKDRNLKVFFDHVMNPSMQIIAMENINRGFEYSDNSLVIRGKSLDLNAILEAVNEIEARCQRQFVQMTPIRKEK